MSRKTLDEMSLIDDFLMSCVAGDPFVGEACCKRILSVLLERQIGRVHVTSQRVIPGFNTDLRGIRMDVELEELEGEAGEETVANVFDIEPQRYRMNDLPRRNRFYQARIDSRRMQSGEKDFRKLPNLYVIMITNFDPFGKEQMVYTFRNHCEEVPDLDYPDGICFMYFNTCGKTGGSQSIRNMLEYIQQSNVTDEATKEVDGYVRSVKSELSMKEGAMTLGEHFDHEREEGARETEIKNILILLESKGDVSEEIKTGLNQIEKMEYLEQLFLDAIKVVNVSDFKKKLEGLPLGKDTQTR